MALAKAADLAWEGLIQTDFDRFVRGFRDSFHSQVRMFPAMMTPEIERVIDKYRKTAAAWKLSGAGGGGYLIIISEEPVKNAFKIKIRLKEMVL